MRSFLILLAVLIVSHGHILAQGSLPLKSLRLTSGFGYRVHPVTGKYCFHSGIDLAARADTVFAVLPGVVSTVGYNPLLGIYTNIDHGNLASTYGHLSQVLVLTGDTVVAGSPIGITGATGRVTGEHLHFSIRSGDSYINPIKFLISILKFNQ